jgi:hypothetical protein
LPLRYYLYFVVKTGVIGTNAATATTAAVVAAAVVVVVCESRCQGIDAHAQFRLLARILPLSLGRGVAVRTQRVRVRDFEPRRFPL